MPGNNAAQRLSELAEQALRTNSNVAMTQGLSVLFNCTPADPYRHHAARLEQVHKQIDVAEAGLARLGVPNFLYEPQFNALRDAEGGPLHWQVKAQWPHISSSLNRYERFFIVPKTHPAFTSIAQHLQPLNMFAGELKSPVFLRLRHYRLPLRKL